MVYKFENIGTFHYITNQASSILKRVNSSNNKESIRLFTFQSREFFHNPDIGYVRLQHIDHGESAISFIGIRETDVIVYMVYISIKQYAFTIYDRCNVHKFDDGGEQVQAFIQECCKKTINVNPIFDKIIVNNNDKKHFHCKEFNQIKDVTFVFSERLNQ